MVTVAASKGRGRHSKSNSAFWCRSGLVINSDTCLPSISLNFVTLTVKLTHSASKCSRKLGQSSKKWLTFSMSTLNRKQIAQSMLQSHEMPPFKPKLPINLVWICRRLTKSGCCSLIDQNLCGDTFSRQAWAICMFGWPYTKSSHAFSSNLWIFLITIVFHAKYIGKVESENQDSKYQICRIYEVSRNYLANTFWSNVCIKITLSSTFKQTSENWSHFGTRNQSTQE